MMDVFPALRNRIVITGKFLLTGLLIVAQAPADASWQSIGPAGAVVEDIAVSPADPDKLFIAGWSQGVFESSDGGQSWQPARTETAGHAVAIDPQNPTIIYAANTTWRDANGVLRSTDGGQTWAEVDGIPSPVSSIVIDATSVPSRVYVSSEYSAYALSYNNSTQVLETLSAGWGHSVRVVLGSGTPRAIFYNTGLHVHKSTDGGITWALYDTGVRNTIDTSDDAYLQGVLADPFTPNTVYTWSKPVYPSSFAQSPGAISGLLKSNDGGVTWTLLNTGLGVDVNNVAADQVTPNVLYALTPEGFYLSRNSGASWERTSGPELFEERTSRITPHPTRSGVLYVGTRAGILMSEDSGRSWVFHDQGLLGGVDINSFATLAGPSGGLFAGGDNYGVYRLGPNSQSLEKHSTVPIYSPWLTTIPGSTELFASGGTAYKSTDDGLTWEWSGWDEAPPGPDDSGIYRILAITPGPSPRLIANHYATSDFNSSFWILGMLLSEDHGASWSRVADGWFTTAAADPLSPESLYVYTPYAFNQIKGGIFRSADGGRTWSFVTDSLPSVEYQTELVVLPTEPRTILFSSVSGLFRSRDNGVSWESIPAGAYWVSLALAAHPTEASTVYVSVKDLGVMMSRDAGDTWIPVDNAGLFGGDVYHLGVSGSSLLASTLNAGVFVRPLHAAATKIPSLSRLGLALFIGVLSVFAVMILRRRPI